jgi:hypothetical protein
MSTSAGASGRKNVRIGERKKKNGGYAPDRERRRTWAVGDVCRRLADLGQAERLVDVDLEPQVGVVPVLDQHAQALAAGLQHALETRAAVQRRRRRVACSCTYVRHVARLASLSEHSAWSAAKSPLTPAAAMAIVATRRTSTLLLGSMAGRGWKS